MDGYEQVFDAALVRTKHYGAHLPTMHRTTQRLLTPVTRQQLANLFAATIDQEPTKEIVLKCIPIHIELSPYIKKIFGNAYLTIGNVTLQGKTYHTLSESEIAQLIRERSRGKPGRRTSDIHVWLTLPSLEIIDVTMMPTYGSLTNHPERMGQKVVDHPEDLEPGLIYHPMAVGLNFLTQIGAARLPPGLAVDL